jgi:hypothetical protein
MSRVLRTLLAAVAACLAFAAPASAVNLITNGSFETGTTAGWTVGGATGVDVVSGWDPTDGVYLLDLNAFHPGSIAQNISTVIGQTYVLEFDLSGNFSTTSTTKTMNVMITGQSTAAYSFAKPLGWTTGSMFWDLNVQQTFVATATTTNVGFFSTISGAEGVALDAISVAAVPAPAALGLLALGLAAVGFSRLRQLR